MGAPSTTSNKARPSVWQCMPTRLSAAAPAAGSPLSSTPAALSASATAAYTAPTPSAIERAGRRSRPHDSDLSLNV
ncbi:hypothetical protein XA68_14321 [Ophiocordyceps unilateralis]|uniref:Uncharacterized protein n=1 Tax=Ophiocordyceps unilateralis TaxID=268505 RepID=A0A2A9P982_OPHUN|nr:hypothetical protein XA68_14321 [Ophiocordyceps unilateralis]